MNWIISFLENRIQRVTVDRIVTVLFSIMVDDIKTADPNNALVKFADDLTLGVPGNESGDTSRSEAACLQDWAKENIMPLNLEKTYEMVVRRHTSVVFPELIPSI